MAFILLKYSIQNEQFEHLISNKLYIKLHFKVLQSVSVQCLVNYHKNIMKCLHILGISSENLTSFRIVLAIGN